eukprot:8440032-Lingulodinium_polyedra.AAC.1
MHDIQTAGGYATVTKRPLSSTRARIIQHTNVYQAAFEQISSRECAQHALAPSSGARVMCAILCHVRARVVPTRRCARPVA